MDERINQAIETFKIGFNCSQAVLMSYIDLFEIDKVTALKLTTGFGAGMARMQETCGAVTAAYMIIGLAFGRSIVDDHAAREKTYTLIKKFNDEFKKQHLSIKCSDLLGIDFSTEKGNQEYAAKNLHSKVCEVCIVDSVKILHELLKIEKII